MNNWRLIVLLVSITFVLACKKGDDSTPVVDSPVNTWFYGADSFKAAYSDIILQKGFTLVFHPNPGFSGNEMISFTFRSKPSTDGQYIPSKDTNSINTVILKLGSDLGNYSSFDADTARLRISFTDGKLNLKVWNVKMMRDTFPNDIVRLSVDLREF